MNTFTAHGATYNAETAAARIEELIAEGAAAEAAGQDPTPFYEAGDEIHDAIAAAEASRLVIAADAPTYWG